MRARKHELSAWMIHEVAKTWPEADADVSEAIDFCEYYGREMLRLAQPRLRREIGKRGQATALKLYDPTMAARSPTFDPSAM